MLYFTTSNLRRKLYGQLKFFLLWTMLRIRIRRIRMFLGLPDPLVQGTDPVPGPSLIIKC